MTADTTTYLLFLDENGDLAKVMDHLLHRREFTKTVLESWQETLIAMVDLHGSDWRFVLKAMGPVHAAFPHAGWAATLLLSSVCTLARRHGPLAIVCEAYFRDTKRSGALVSRDTLIEIFAPMCVALPRAAAKDGLSPNDYKYVTWADELTHADLERHKIAVCATIDEWDASSGRPPSTGFLRNPSEYYRPYAYAGPAPVAGAPPANDARTTEPSPSGVRPWAHATFKLLAGNDDSFAYDAEAMRADLEHVRASRRGGAPNASILLALREFRIELFRVLFYTEKPIDWMQGEKDLCLLENVERALRQVYSLHRIEK